MKLSEFFSRHHIDASFFEADGKINFGLWYQEAKYSVLIQKIGPNRIIASLLENDVSFENPTFDFKSSERSIITSFDQFLKEWGNLENEIFPDRALEWWKKPFLIWEQMEKKLCPDMI